jgi:hypothetical protein
LPETLTVSFSGLADKAPGPDLISLSFSACYGGGATAQVTAPGGDPATDKGAIGAVTLTNGGSGYAKLGRVAPTLTVSGGSGTGATFTPSLSTSQDECDLDLWALQSVAASGGTGYEDGDTLTITVAEGDTEVAAASATLYLDKSEPTLTLDGTATATVAMAGLGDGNFGIASVAVTGGGSGYTEGQSVTFSVGANDETVAAATATARVVHGSPANALLYEEGTGSGAVLTPVWTLLPISQWPAPNKKAYSVSSVTITNGGSGYSSADYFEFYFASDDDGQVVEYGYGFVDAVNGSGAITAVSIESGGRYVGSRTDQLESVAIASGGSYYNDDPGARSVLVNAGGTYYREDASASPYVATVTVGVSQTAPSAGAGATLTVDIDDDTSSETFGQITGVSSSGGSGYLAHELFDTCMTRFDGRSIVVRRTGNPCLYAFSCEWDRECGLEQESVYVQYRGPTQPLTVEMGLSRPTGGRADGQRIWILVENPSMTADELSPDCSAIDVTATGGSGVPEGATAHVVGGGEYEETETCKTILSEDVAALHVELSWGGLTNSTQTGSGCGRGSTFYIPGASQSSPTLSWCDAWKEGEQDRKDGVEAATTNFGGFASWTESCGPRTLAIQGNGVAGLELKGCNWKWIAQGEVCVELSESAQIFFQTNTSYGLSNSTVAGTRVCRWCYPVLSVAVDGDFVPTGAVTLGTPVFTTSLPVSPGSIDVAFWFDDYLSAGSVCNNPGTPTVTLSRLP